MTTNTESASFRFESEYLGVDTFSVLRFRGEEAISRLYRFDVELVARDGQIDLAQMLIYPVTLYIEAYGRSSCFHGMLETFELGREMGDDQFAYRAVLVPRIWMWSLSRQNQIYQQMSIPEIVEQELGDTSNRGDHPLVGGGIHGDDIVVNLLGEYPVREYVVQYRESDLDFMARRMEHLGIFYFFDQRADAETLYIGDHNGCFPDLPETELPYQPPSGLANLSQAAVFDMRCQRRQRPKGVAMRDFNYHRPDVEMHAERDVGTGYGFGLVNEYGANFKTADEGERLAGARAEELGSTGLVLEASSNGPSMRSGHCFNLTGHFRAEFNTRLLVTRVVHEGEQSVAGVSGVGDASTTTTYRNEFSCMPAEVAYRPPRITPIPRLYGIMNGIISGEQQHGRAEIDDLGRYKVDIAFDTSGATSGKGSHYIRMAQPYVGSQHGMHFPLHPGTEVIWACIDGDLDRPIILGAVPNATNASVVNAENSTNNVIRTASGVLIEFADGSG